jgi:hypothetical protein
MSSGSAEPINSNEVNAGSAEMSEAELRAELQKLQPKSELGKNLTRTSRNQKGFVTN